MKLNVGSLKRSTRLIKLWPGRSGTELQRQRRAWREGHAHRAPVPRTGDEGRARSAVPSQNPKAQPHPALACCRQHPSERSGGAGVAGTELGPSRNAALGTGKDAGGLCPREGDVGRPGSGHPWLTASSTMRDDFLSLRPPA